MRKTIQWLLLGAAGALVLIADAPEDLRAWPGNECTPMHNFWSEYEWDEDGTTYWWHIGDAEEIDNPAYHFNDEGAEWALWESHWWGHWYGHTLLGVDQHDEEEHTVDYGSCGEPGDDDGGPGQGN